MPVAGCNYCTTNYQGSCDGTVIGTRTRGELQCNYCTWPVGKFHYRSMPFNHDRSSWTVTNSLEPKHKKVINHITYFID